MVTRNPLQLEGKAPSKGVETGCDVETGASVAIGDVERRSGLYVLGKSGMGKSGLLVNMAAQDIQNGHGLFFLDPHGEAIEDLFRRYSFDREVIFLDPADEKQSFGINLLACGNVESITQREDALQSD